MAGELPNPATPYVRTFGCPNCGAGVTVRGGGGTLSAVCESCRAIVDVADPNFKIIQKAREKVLIEPHIPLGQRGKLRGVLWEVIGFMQRMDVGSGYSWREYLLFNPYYGYRWLSESNGHWNYVTITKEKPHLGHQKAAFLARTYNLFHKGQARVNYVMGEFYWRVKVGDTVEVLDYIAPPEVLSSEIDIVDKEQTWSVGEYITANEVREAFKITGTLPTPTGVAPNQPSPIDPQMPKIMTLWVVFVCFILVVQIANIALAKNEIVFDQIYLRDSQKTIVTPSFELKNGQANLQVDLSSTISNNWLQVEADLVNEKTGETYSFDETLEYYYGREGGEDWAEGSQRRSVLLSSIPEGTYHFDLQTSGAPYNSLNVTLTRQVVNWGNFIWSILFVSLLPVISLFRRYGFETSRWADSDYSPYDTSEGDD